MEEAEDEVDKVLVTVTALGLAAALAGCSGKPPKQAGDENNFEQTPTATTAAAEAPPSGGDPGPSGGENKSGLNEEQQAQMMIALKRGGEKASKCAEGGPDAPGGEGEVKVLFDGKKGRVTEATVGPPFAGTPVEACIKRAFVGEIVLPFDGDPKEVPYSVKLPEKKGAAPDKKKK